MKILIIGFQRSGTTLLRRIVQGHPEVRRILHEVFLLKHCDTKKKTLRFVQNYGIKKPEKDIWGEKVPFYPGIRGISVLEYCNRWKGYFGKQCRIIHIIRHPVDVCFSVDKMYKNQNFEKALSTYKKIIPKVVIELTKIPYVYNVKYEDILVNPDEILPKLFSFCKLNPKANFKKYMLRSDKVKYKKLDPSRAFAYKRLKKIPTKDVSEVIKLINDKVEGVKYN